MLQAGEPVKMTVDLSVAWQDADQMGGRQRHRRHVLEG